MIDNQTHESLMRARGRIYAALLAAADHRSERDDWETFEREAMVQAANKYGRDHGLADITVGQVEEIEHLAMGHIDYALKISLYVAELLHGLRPWA